MTYTTSANYATEKWTLTIHESAKDDVKVRVIISSPMASCRKQGVKFMMFNFMTFLESWKEVFKNMYDKNESGGSSRWLVAPSTVEVFIENLLVSTRRDERAKVCDEILENVMNDLGYTSAELHALRLVITQIKSLWKKQSLFSLSWYWYERK